MTDLLTTLVTSLEQLPATVEICASWDEARAWIDARIGDEFAIIDGDPELAGLVAPRTDEVWDAEWGVSLADAAAASTGTLLITSARHRRRATGANPLHHIVAMDAATIVSTYADLVAMVASYPKLPSLVRFTTGPSRSGDIELKTIYGMHGPASLTVVVINDPTAATEN